MSTEQAINHLNAAKRLLNEPKSFNVDGYDPIKLAEFDYRDDFAWTFYQGDIDAAITELKKAVESDANLGEAHTLLASLLVVKKEYIQAIDFYQQAIKLDQQNLILQLNYAVTFDRIGKEDEAIAIYLLLKQNQEFPYPWLIDVFYDKNQTAAEILNQQLQQESATHSQNIIHKVKRLFQSESTCIFCGKSNLIPYYLNQKTNYQVVHCLNCGLYFVSPQPTESEISRKYEHTYFTPFLSDAEKLFKLWKEWRTEGKIFSPTGKQFSIVFSWLDSLGLKEHETQLGDTRKMLDLGCATCGLMAEMINRGWTTSGIELSPEIIEFDRKHGFDVVQGPIERVKYANASFGLITMTHVIEHLLNPKRTLQEVYRILAPKGKLFIRTPNCDSFPRLIAGENWFSDPDHLTFFGTGTLKKILDDSGFRIIGFKNYVGVDMETYSAVWNKLGLNDIIRARINQMNLGDVALVYAEKI
jgi:SAM-dependent methyltransferase